MYGHEHCDVFTSERNICVTGGVLALFGRHASLQELDTI